MQFEGDTVCLNSSYPNGRKGENSPFCCLLDWNVNDCTADTSDDEDKIWTLAFGIVATAAGVVAAVAAATAATAVVGIFSLAEGNTRKSFANDVVDVVVVEESIFSVCSFDLEWLKFIATFGTSNGITSGRYWHFLACVLILLDWVKDWLQFGCGQTYGLQPVW